MFGVGCGHGGFELGDAAAERVELCELGVGARNGAFELVDPLLTGRERVLQLFVFGVGFGDGGFELGDAAADAFELGEFGVGAADRELELGDALLTGREGVFELFVFAARLRDGGFEFGDAAADAFELGEFGVGAADRELELGDALLTGRRGRVRVVRVRCSTP